MSLPMKQSTLTTSLPTNNIEQHQHFNLNRLRHSVRSHNSKSDQGRLHSSARGGGLPATHHHEDGHLGKDGCCVCVFRQELISPGALLTLESQRRYHVHRRPSTDLLRHANGRGIVHGMSHSLPTKIRKLSHLRTKRI